jgi:hypothetical protein
LNQKRTRDLRLRRKAGLDEQPFQIYHTFSHARQGKWLRPSGRGPSTRLTGKDGIVEKTWLHVCRDGIACGLRRLVNGPALAEADRWTHGDPDPASHSVTESHAQTDANTQPGASREAFRFFLCRGNENC